MMVIGYFAAGLIGVALGLTGGGGSILTMPVLVYLFGVSPVVAAAYSLFVVGSTSLVGAAGKIKEQLVNARAVTYFGLPSLLAVFVTRKWIMPALPDVFFYAGSFPFTKSLFTLLLFSVLMIMAGVAMIANKTMHTDDESGASPWWRIASQGIFTGLVTGLVGAGGGFLIVPALMWMLKLPVKTAIGSSLVIIAINSLAGFAGDLMNYPIEWGFVLPIAAMAVAGIFIGNRLQRFIKADVLKKAFGWFVLAMGIYIIIKELLFK
ncbi:sulfite exporter TauE/SafE family protein [Paraflavitalea sp. CAU 1676]|uniref:sulfite exporter TauE/SafE family protein n=1 Tax=Paraflavitalea sp. CAU 1676 TaxID=3032598 RepID=UPI0023DA15A3|nr:sulfite exporter TauE/SafE family protein [Paraflavitalea sp. CAU 1676]MDF2193569.1 sulfite exporter TauE/SafE family protein [Paraflavitalea sp. CAU 1676]